MNKCGTLSGYRKHYRDKEPPCLKCKEAQNLYYLEYAEKNKKNISKSKKHWRLQNKEHLSEYKKEYREKKLTKVKNDIKKWKNNNKEKVRYSNRKRRSLSKGVMHEPYTENDVINLYGNICYLCHEEIDITMSRKIGKDGWQKSLHIDHVIAISNGGPDIISNVRPSHAVCNLTKGSKFLYN